MTTLPKLIEALTLEPIEVNLFRGFTPEDERGRHRIYGGQVIAQALSAAYKTVDNRYCHSLQAYFIHPGDPKAPILYEVERSRDGRSFTTRRVIAIQHGEQILNLAASFHIEEPGFEHQTPMPQVPPPEALQSFSVFVASDLKLPMEEEIRRQGEAIELKIVDPRSLQEPTPRPPQQQAWFRANGALPADDAILSQLVMAYASDMMLLDTGLRPHGVSWLKGVQNASLDHIMWFHHKTNFSDWHLYDMDSPAASGARGINRGLIYNSAGLLVASACQEGLMRPLLAKT
jgi:acyl-CoA thioesterase-2